MGPCVDLVAQLLPVKLTTVVGDELVELLDDVRTQILGCPSSDLSLAEAATLPARNAAAVSGSLSSATAVSIWARASPRVSRSRRANRSAVDRAPWARQVWRASASATQRSFSAAATVSTRCNRTTRSLNASSSMSPSNGRMLSNARLRSIRSSSMASSSSSNEGIPVAVPLFEHMFVLWHDRMGWQGWHTICGYCSCSAVRAAASQ
jgi:hypothetical protein